MEFIIDDNTGKRVPIPDAVVAASDNRDLVADYVAANPRERDTIHQLAIEQTTPKDEPKAESSATPSQPQSAPVPDSGEE